MIGYVAFVDVLGFSSRVLRDSSLDFFPAFTSLLERTISGLGDSGIGCILSSDSIVIYSEDSGEQSLLAVAKACSQLSFSLLDLDLPVRGCLSHGSFSRVETQFGAVLAGRPIIDAYRYEEQQNWVGIMISPATIEAYPSLCEKQGLLLCRDAAEVRRFQEDYPWPLLIQQCTSIPFHHVSELESNIYDGYAIVPTRPGDANPDDVVETIGLSIGQLRRLKSLAPDPQSQKKYAATMLWLEEVKSRWESMASAG
jgi:hypothetical protein